MPDIEVNLTDNSDLVKNALEEQIEQALTAIGLTAETKAKEEVKETLTSVQNKQQEVIDINKIKNIIDKLPLFLYINLNKNLFHYL